MWKCRSVEMRKRGRRKGGRKKAERQQAAGSRQYEAVSRKRVEGCARSPQTQLQKQIDGGLKPAPTR
jgi:hypothetical protein